MSAPGRLTLQIRTIVVALVASLVALVGFGYYAVTQVDQDSLARQTHLALNALTSERDDLGRQQQLATASTEAWTYVRNSNDQQWIDQHLGSKLHANFGHNRVYILRPDGSIVYAMAEGVALAPEEARLPAKIEQAVQRARKRGLLSPVDGQMPTADAVMLDGTPTMVSLVSLRSSLTGMRRVSGDEYVHVSVRYLDAELLKKLSFRFRLPNSRFESLGQGSTVARIPLFNTDTNLLGYLAWDPIRPARTLVYQLLPGFLAVSLLIAAVLAILLYRFRRTTLQLQNSESTAKHLALHDPLTDLPNRTLFNERLRNALEKGAQQKRKTALLSLDLDHFKHINDTLGHPAGDALIQTVARRFEKLVRKGDTVSRLGGDEFGIVLENITDVCTIQTVAERLIAAMAEPFDLGGEVVHIGASVGVVVAPDSGLGAEDLRRKADIALYEAKKNGRGRFQVFTADMDEVLIRRRRIESDLRAALHTGEGLSLAFQPIMAADGTTIAGAEALIRWSHAVHGPIATDQFVALAEQRGLIQPLGTWVTKSALEFLATCNLPWVAINVSPIELRDPAFADHLLGLLAEHKVSPSRLQVEITEGVLLEGQRTVTTALRALRAAGVTIALDDFGTGYSSLGYLRRHTIDKLKIDRTFVRELGRGRESDAIVEAVVDIAKAMGLKVTAEGVETMTQFKRSVDLGCSELQGFLFSQALPASEMRQLFARATPQMMVDLRRA